MFPLSFYTFLLYSTFSVMVFFFPLYLQEQGLRSDQIGIVISVGAFITIFARPFWGYMSDKKKTVKKILWITMFGALLTSLGLFSVHTFLLIVLFNFLFFFFSSAWIPLTDTLTLSFAYKNNYNYGSFRLWGEIGAGLSALLLGLFIQRVGMSSLILIHSGILCLAMLFFIRIQDATMSRIPVNLQSLRQLLSRGSLIWFLVIVLFISIPHRLNDSMLAIFMSEMNATESQLGLAWMLAALSTIPALILSGRIIKRYGELKVFLFAAVMYVIRWIIYSFADSPDILIYSQLLHSVTFPLFLVSSIQFVVKLAPEELSSTGQTAFASVFGGLGGIIGSIMGGWIIHNFSPQAAYLTSSVFALIGAAGAFGMIWYQRRTLAKGIDQDSGQPMV